MARRLRRTAARLLRKKLLLGNSVTITEDTDGLHQAALPGVKAEAEDVVDLRAPVEEVGDHQAEEDAACSANPAGSNKDEDSPPCKRARTGSHDALAPAGPAPAFSSILAQACAALAPAQATDPLSVRWEERPCQRDPQLLGPALSRLKQVVQKAHPASFAAPELPLDVGLWSDIEPQLPPFFNAKAPLGPQHVEVRRILPDDPRPALRGQCGLFARKDLKKHQLLGHYGGCVRARDLSRMSQNYLSLSPSLDQQLQHHRYAYGFSHKLAEAPMLGLWVDGWGSGNQFSIMNDCRKQPFVEYRTRHAPANVQYVEVLHHGWPHVLVITRDRVQAGSELLVDYGLKYWTDLNILQLLWNDDVRRAHCEVYRKLQTLLTAAGEGRLTLDSAPAAAKPPASINTAEDGPPEDSPDGESESLVLGTLSGGLKDAWQAWTSTSAAAAGDARAACPRSVSPPLSAPSSADSAVSVSSAHSSQADTEDPERWEGHVEAWAEHSPGDGRALRWARRVKLQDKWQSLRALERGLAQSLRDAGKPAPPTVPEEVPTAAEGTAPEGSGGAGAAPRGSLVPPPTVS